MNDKIEDPRIQMIADALQSEMLLVPVPKDGSKLDYVPSIVNQFKLHDVAYALIEFQGGGDSGQVELVMIRFKGSEENHTEYSFSHKQTDKANLFDILANWAVEIPDVQAHDWWNNDGGNGTVEFNLEEGTFKYEVNQHETISETVASHEEEI